MNKFERVTGYDHVKLPERKTAGSAGYDFYLPQEVILQPGMSTYIPLGIKVKLEPDKLLKIYARSSLASRGLIIPNSVGIIDPDYYGNDDNEGNIHLVLYNITDRVLKLQTGDRVCQGIFTHFYTVDDEEPITVQRTGGLGSTG